MRKKRQLRNENQLSFLCKFIHKVTNPLICHLNDNTYNVNMKSEKLIKRRSISVKQKSIKTYKKRQT